MVLSGFAKGNIATLVDAKLIAEGPVQHKRYIAMGMAVTGRLASRPHADQLHIGHRQSANLDTAKRPLPFWTGFQNSFNIVYFQTRAACSARRRAISLGIERNGFEKHATRHIPQRAHVARPRIDTGLNIAKQRHTRRKAARAMVKQKAQQVFRVRFHNMCRSLFSALYAVSNSMDQGALLPIGTAELSVMKTTESLENA
jgi:hypothetical protein